MTSFPSTAKLPIAVIGAGAIGRKHVERTLRHAEVQLVAIVDPTPEARLWHVAEHTVLSRPSSDASGMPHRRSHRCHPQFDTR